MVVRILFLLTCCQVALFSDYDFDRMMGKGTEVFNLIETKEDRRNLKLFRKYYHRNLQVVPCLGQNRIPKIIHFIWCGPRPLSKEMQSNMLTWIQKHPEWTFKFWSDRKHRMPHPKIKVSFIEQLDFKRLKHKYKSTLNYAEREELVAYELLSKQGGICVHPEVLCRSAFEQIVKDYDFFAFVSKPHVYAASTSVYLDHGLLGSKPAHPKIEKAITNIIDSWTNIEHAFPIDSEESFEYRQVYRTRLALDKAVRELQDDTSTHDLIFPTGFLYSINHKEPFLALATEFKRPYKGEITFEEKVDHQVDAIIRKEQKLLLMHLVLIGTLIAGFFVLFKKRYI